MADQVSGIYAGNDGGFYYVRFVDDGVGGPGGPIFWFGEHPDGIFANVMAGTLNVFGEGDFSIENGRWWDVPKGSTVAFSTPSRPETQLDLLIEGPQMRKSMDSAPAFGGSRWNRIATRPRRGANNLSGFSGEGLTGVWIGNDGGIYYVRQTGTEVVWFGEACTPSGAIVPFANVFVGTLSGTTVSGSWADVPYGTTAGAGRLSFRVEGDRLVRTSVTGGFGGNSWTRSRVSGSTVISSVRVTVTTANLVTIPEPANPDNLRGGSVAYGVLELSGGRTLPRVNLNGGRELPPGASATADISLPPGTRRNDIVSFILEHDGAPRDVLQTYDNWDVGSVEVNFSLGSSPCTGRLASASGTPFTRLSGRKTSERIGIRPL